MICLFPITENCLFLIIYFNYFSVNLTATACLIESSTQLDQNKNKAEKRSCVTGGGPNNRLSMLSPTWQGSVNPLWHHKGTRFEGQGEQQRKKKVYCHMEFTKRAETNSKVKRSKEFAKYVCRRLTIREQVVIRSASRNNNLLHKLLKETLLLRFICWQCVFLTTLAGCWGNLCTSL